MLTASVIANNTSPVATSPSRSCGRRAATPSPPDRQDDGSQQDRAAHGAHVVGEDRNPRQMLLEECLESQRVTEQKVDAPQSVDHRRDRGQQVDEVAQRPRDPRRSVLGHVQRDAERDRHGHHQGKKTRQHSPEHQRRDPEDRRRLVGKELALGEEVAAVLVQRRQRLADQEHGDEDDDGEHEQARPTGEPAEYPVPEPRLAARALGRLLATRCRLALRLCIGPGLLRPGGSKPSGTGWAVLAHPLSLSCPLRWPDPPVPGPP